MLLVAVFYVIGTVYLVSVIYNSVLCLHALPPFFVTIPHAGWSTAFATNPYQLFIELHFVGYFPTLFKTSAGQVARSV
jgi:hypothetical protein